MVRHFLRLRDLQSSDLRNIISDSTVSKKAANVVQQRAIYQEEKVLHGTTTALIFDKPSMRTRVSFEVGIRQLGGEVIFLPASDVRFGKGESLHDIAKVLSSYVDFVVIRTFSEQSVTEFAKYSCVPVINGLTDNSHPCQVITDIFTYEETFNKSVEGQRILWVGDGNNVCNSFIEAAVKLNFTLVISCPPELMPDPQLSMWAKNNNTGEIIFEQDPIKASHNVSAIVTDTWNSMHHDSDRSEILRPYVVTEELLKHADDNVIFMHCLPAYRGQEVQAEVMDGKHSVVFRGANNRLHVQKSILKWCSGLL